MLANGKLNLQKDESEDRGTHLLLSKIVLFFGNEIQKGVGYA
jgi:hypothetical protein